MENNSEISNNITAVSLGSKKQCLDFPYRCNICNTTFETSQYLEVHKMWLHVETDDYNASPVSEKSNSYTTVSMPVVNTSSVAIKSEVLELPDLYLTVPKVVVFTKSVAGKANFLEMLTSCTTVSRVVLDPSSIASKSNVLEQSNSYCKIPIPKVVVPSSVAIKSNVLKKSNSYATVPKPVVDPSSVASKIDSTKAFKCKQCNEAFSSVIYLNVHMRQHSKTSNKRFVCSVCGLSFPSETLLVSHSLAGHPGYEISLKNEVNNSSNLQDHNMGAKCEICDLFFTNDHRMKVHMKRHTLLDNNICHHCSQVFSTSKLLLYHVKNIHPEHGLPNKNFLTDTEENQIQLNADNYHSSMDKRTKLKTQSKIVCLICGDHFLNKLSLKKHLKLIHPDSLTNTAHSSKEPHNTSNLSWYVQPNSLTKSESSSLDKSDPSWCFVCTYCGAGFSDKSSLKHHSQDVHPELKPAKTSFQYVTTKTLENVDVDSAPVLPTNKTLVKEDLFCDTCSLSFDSLIYFKVHLRLHKTNQI